jgi:hypothetical protein
VREHRFALFIGQMSIREVARNDEFEKKARSS